MTLELLTHKFLHLLESFSESEYPNDINVAMANMENLQVEILSHLDFFLVCEVGNKFVIQKAKSEKYVKLMPNEIATSLKPFIVAECDFENAYLFDSLDSAYQSLDYLNDSLFKEYIAKQDRIKTDMIR